MKKYTMAVLLLCSMWACQKAASPQVSKADTAIIRTVIKYRETVRDSLVQVPPDSAWLEALLACDSNGNVLLKQLQAYEAGRNVRVPGLSLTENRLRVLNQQDSFLVWLKWRENYQEVDSTTESRSEEVVVLPAERINYVTGWQQFFIKTGQIAWILIAVGVIAWFIKKAVFKIKESYGSYKI